MLKNKKMVSMLLAMAMVLSIGCVGVFAEDVTGDLASSSQQSASIIAPRVAQYVWTNTTVNLRTGPGTNYSVITTLAPNTRLWITYAEYDAYGVDWYYCPDANGWVCSLYVRYQQ